MMKRKLNKAQREQRKSWIAAMNPLGRFRQLGTMRQMLSWFGVSMGTKEHVDRITDAARRGHEASESSIGGTVGNRGSFRPAGSKYARRMSRREDGKSNRRLCCA